MTRSEAYGLFESTPIAGLGPAYFTKLIFFLLQSNDGYILDQWTGKSVSILFEPCFIAFDHSGYVARRNSAHVYERYCRNVEALAERLDLAASRTEELLFSRGGRPKHPWRHYVVQNWKRSPARSV
ncbi:hypothetical protein FS320_26650 [Microvirga tunisiensis]|uniref:Uncharacterized protein n=2 Tax=Microvirga tunisiensis TaxID=2108360 RepID=A0A5N7MX30_9HYPH|nr:hypothetical protein [Microvirga tunisiensis]MPR11501.1 hypothetical protein [Microvirga tunisiensis]MPR28626.1 hypothetical protein [Microvirga tunisiensis]